VTASQRIVVRAPPARPISDAAFTSNTRTITRTTYVAVVDWRAGQRPTRVVVAVAAGVDRVPVRPQLALSAARHGSRHVILRV
jgi:hypothetical protein